MWRTKFGIKLITKFTKKFGGIMRRMQWLIVAIGTVLMGIMIWMLGRTVAIYLFHPEITKVIKVPPIAPLIPYFPRLFGMQSLFPPFYFTYFIIALAIVAIAHEFSHGVFMKLFKVKIKSTGLVFFGPILGAFVEEKKESFRKKKTLEQMTILGAGVFANILMALLFYAIYVGFFFSSFAASGYVFNSYGVGIVPVQNITGFQKVGNFTKVITSNGNYYLDANLRRQINDTNRKYLVAYPEAPAVLAGMKGAIIQADNVKILGQDSLRWFLENKKPGDVVKFITESKTGDEEYDIMLGRRPDDSAKAYLGVGYKEAVPRGFVQKFLAKFMSFKDPTTYYKPRWDASLVYFAYYLFWWIMIINLLVAIFNMIPLGILDGGRFFYLAMFGLSHSKKFAERTYRMMSYLIIFMFVAMMVLWVIAIL